MSKPPSSTVLEFDPNLSILRCVLVVLLAGCCDEKAIPREVEALYSSAAKERNEAALALARCGGEASRAVGRLGQLLYDQNVGVQSSAAYALRKIDTPEARGILERAINAKKRKK
ncbi:MAG: hypothetical protein K1X79_05680 [Oligoflexia bacterium]|nr:hypothetical protein [Oligoflexia bacterium]